MRPNYITNAKKWRPIQSSLVLTDHHGCESGGLKLVKGFHKDYFSVNRHVEELSGHDNREILFIEMNEKKL